MTHLKLLILLLVALPVFLPNTASAKKSKTPDDTSAMVSNRAATTEATKKISIAIGEIKRLSLDGISPFVADVDIVTVEELPITQEIRIIGIRGGTTQIYYWKDSVLHFLVVEVVLSPVLSSSNKLNPTFKNNLPYFLYLFQNNSSFSETAFFQSPAYAHSLFSYFPSRAGQFSAYTSFNHQGNGVYSLPTASMTYQHKDFKFSSGQSFAAISQLLNIFGGASFFGSTLNFKTQGTTFENLAIFGGFASPADLLKPSVQEQIYGMTYSSTRYQANRLTPDFVNSSFFGYQPFGESTFTGAGVLEGNYHISRLFALGAGYAHTLDNRFAFVVRPSLELPNGLIQAKHAFIQNSLQDIGSTPQTNTTHDTTLSATYALNDQRTIVSGGFFNGIIVANPTSDTSSWSTGGTIAVSRRTSYRQSYGFSYGVSLVQSDTQDILVNSLGVGWVHPLGRAAFLNHSVSYSRSDLDSSANGVSLSNTFDIETNRLRYQTFLLTSMSDSSGLTKSVSLGQSAELVLPRGTVGASIFYQNPDIGVNEHSMQFSPTVDYQLTRNQLILLTGSVFASFTTSTTFNGSLSVQYQRFLGPAVVADPLLKHLIGGGNKSSVNGQVFLDKNYNSFYQSTIDTPLAGVTLILDDKRRTTTDATGYFVFKHVRAGEHRLTLDATTLPLSEESNVVTKQRFTLADTKSIDLPIPVTFKKATLRVQFLIDANDNHMADIDDQPIAMGNGFLIGPSGDKRDFSTERQGKGILRGIDLGRNTIGFDQLALPEGVEAQGASKQVINVTAFEEYPVAFLFRAVRSQRGRLLTLQDKPLPRGLTLHLGAYFSSVDQDGYYWFKSLAPGDYTMQIKGLPKTACIETPSVLTVSVPKGTFTQTQDILIQSPCATTK